MSFIDTFGLRQPDVTGSMIPVSPSMQGRTHALAARPAKFFGANISMITTLTQSTSF
nr:hypothetical protein [uncultured Massilia sp.]